MTQTRTVVSEAELADDPAMGRELTPEEFEAACQGVGEQIAAAYREVLADAAKGQAEQYADGGAEFSADGGASEFMGGAALAVGEFVEEEHPRDKSGEFTEKGGGVAAKGESGGDKSAKKPAHHRVAPTAAEAASKMDREEARFIKPVTRKSTGSTT